MMTLEQKAAAYDKALERAQSLYNDKNEIGYTNTESILEEVFPSLKENNEEKTEKILHSISSKISFHLRDIFTEEEFQCFDTWSNAWLEKQGEQNDSDVKDYNSIDPHFAKPADKVEPKFKVGDYVVGKYISGYISEVRDDCYLLDYQGFSIDKQDNYHLWTIDDAKDGDVLCTPNGNTFIFKTIDGDKILDYCGLYFNKFFSDFGSPNGSSTHYDKCNYHPATKEQRDLLFQKMKEAGYEWDAENLQLTKILHVKELSDGINIDKQKTAEWSEEDKYMIEDICYAFEKGSSQYKWLKSLKSRILPQPKQEWNEEDERTIKEIDEIIYECPYCESKEEISNWLKSIKQRIIG